jgi:hypothetical protein
MLSERQQLAKRLADELGKMDGAWVTSPLPLDEHAKLRVQIKDIDRNRIIQWLRDLGWEPVFVSILPRICTTGLIAAGLWEIDLPRERQPIPQDDRVIPKDEVGHRETNREVELMRLAIYGKRK